jgi:hypothetical protein
MPFLPHWISLGCILLFTSCTNSDRYHGLGQPTEMKPGETPLEIICRIQHEFIDLPKPLLVGTRFHEKTYDYEWIEFGLYRMPRDAYYEFILSDDANDFLKRHSRSEVIFSLLPLITAPSLGGEVAVTLAGLPVISRKEAHMKIVRPSKFLYGTGYQSNDARGGWNLDSAIAFIDYLQPIDGRIPLYNLQRADGNPEQSQRNQNTLESHLARFWAHYRKLLHEHPDERRGFVEIGETQNAPTRQEWLDLNPPPLLGQTLQILIRQYGKVLTQLALYPAHVTGGLDVWVLDLHDYWPLAYFGTWSNWHYTGPYSGRRGKDDVDYINDYRRLHHQRIFSLNRTACNLENKLTAIPEAMIRTQSAQLKSSESL